jgi:signal transduction histidine kinase
VHDRNGAAAQSELSRHLLQAQEEERKRISRELHDETGQGLMVLRLYLGMLAGDSDSPQLKLKVEEAMTMLDRTIGDLRRIIARLSPRTLEELGLLAAIRKEVRELAKHTGMKAQIDLPEALGEVDHEIQIAIYRSVQESLHNIAKHSQAKNFSLRVENQHGALCLLVDDDGIGFTGKGNPRRQSFGLLGMRERIAALGGTVRVRSRSGRGTRLRVMLPVTQATGTRKHVSSVRSEPERRRAHVPVEIKHGGRPQPAIRTVKPHTQYANVH